MSKAKHLYAISQEGDLLNDFKDWRTYAYATRIAAVEARREMCNILGKNTRDFPIIKFVLEN